MRAEIDLKSINRKINVLIVGGSESTLYTSIPERRNNEVHFSSGEFVQISCYYVEHAFHFLTKFVKIESVENQNVYQFSITDIKILQNNRKETRRNVEQPAAIFNKTELHFATILDISQNGMKVETTLPILDKDIKIRYGLSSVVSGIIIWEKIEDNRFFYGVKLNHNEGDEKR